MQFATYHRLGVAVEILEGKLEGSKAFVYLTPKEETTGVTVVGDFLDYVRNLPQTRSLIYGKEFI
jgi:hypothetical protein